MENIQSLETAANVEFHDAMNACQRAVKRLVDIGVSLFGILLLFPILAVIYLVLLFTNGSTIYKQERIGYKGKPFTIYKFRTMKEDAEKHGIPRTAKERSEQMTRVGRFLCEHHLDELPQMFNVLNGDMSLVGPRPERAVFINEIMKVDSRYVYIYKMRPGLTSKATLYNGYTDSLEKMITRLDMDIEYLTTRSLWGDFVIVCKTAFSIVSGKKF